ncbi:Sec8 exocyst complex component-specific domain-containing protein [Hyaloraphidium curvatum]|nr:Sec8 exocyst complex component-specific domain-containing protein [Hyaloraphidium curvatum]
MFGRKKLGVGGTNRPRPQNGDGSLDQSAPVSAPSSYAVAPVDGFVGDGGQWAGASGYGYVPQAGAAESFGQRPSASDVGSRSLTSASEAAAARLFGLAPASSSPAPPNRARVEVAEKLNPEVEATLAFIEQQWGFMTDEQFDPISMALSLMDQSSLGHDFNAFLHALGRLEKAMDILVNDYFQTFNDSIHTFSGVVETVVDSQKRADQMRKALLNSRDLLHAKRSDLMDLWLKSVKYKEMLRMIDAIAELHEAPDNVEILLNQKYFLQALTTIQKSLQTLASPEYAGVAALSSVRTSLERVYSTLPETLIEELHNHIYLKNAFSMDRLWVHQANRAANGRSNSVAAKEASKARGGASDEIFEDTDVNPELDSFHYMEVLLESLRMTNQLPAAISALRQRFRIELFELTERTADEILEKSGASKGGMASSDADTLQEFLSVLYRRLEVVMQAHLFVLEVIRTKLKQISTAERVPLYSISDVWIAVQDEVKTMLSEHLTESDATQKYTTAALSLNDLLRNPRGLAREGIVKSIFQMPDTDASDALVLRYRNAVGLAEKPFPTGATAAPLVSDAGLARKGTRRLLATPDSRRVLVVYKPTSDFVERMESVLATESAEVSDFRSFLDDFILNTLLPKVEDEIMDYFHDLINGEDAFQAHLDEVLSPFPLLNSVVGVCALLESMGLLLHYLPVHKDHFVNTMEVVVWKFSEKCVAKYRHVMANETTDGRGSSKIVSAAWAQDPSLSNVLTLFYESSADADGERVEKLSEEEFHALEKLKGDRSFHRSELVFDARKLAFLANLHHSLQWFRDQIALFRKTTYQAARSSVSHRLPARSQAAFWRLQRLSGLHPTTRQKILDIPPESVARFEAMFKSLEIFADTCLLALRIELRCHAFYFLDLAFIEGNYELDDEPSDLDPYIVELNQDMVRAQEAISGTMALDRVRFVFEGMDIAINKIVEKNIPHIRNINANGKLKLRRGIGSLEQLEAWLAQQYPR